MQRLSFADRVAAIPEDENLDSSDVSDGECENDSDLESNDGECDFCINRPSAFEKKKHIHLCPLGTGPFGCGMQRDRRSVGTGGSNQGARGQQGSSA